MSTKGTLELIVFHSCPQVTSLLRLLSARRPALLNKSPLFRNKASLLIDKCCLFAIPGLDAYSQRGNALFPTWECHVPNVGIIHSQRGNNC